MRDTPEPLKEPQSCHELNWLRPIQLIYIQIHIQSYIHIRTSVYVSSLRSVIAHTNLIYMSFTF